MLRACSLLLIPPPPPGVKYRVKSIPMSLAEIAAPDWTKLVQDLASHMEALPMGFCVTEQQMSSLLAKLERATGHPSCSTCQYPRRRCLCASGGSTLVSHSSWSNVVSVDTSYEREYPPPTRSTTTMSFSQSRAPAHMVTAPPQGVVSPVKRQPTMGIQGLAHRAPVLGSVNYATAPIPRPTIRQPGPRLPLTQPQEPSTMEIPADQTPISRPPTPYSAFLQSAGRGRGVLRTATPTQLTTPGTSQIQGGATPG